MTRIPISSLPQKYQDQVLAGLHPKRTGPACSENGILGMSNAEITRLHACPQHFAIHVEPMGKPRQTQRDKWAKRPCVMRYRAYADILRANCPNVKLNPTTVSWTAYFPVPESWSKKKRGFMAGKPHRQKPDRDNVDKGILDALWTSDEGIAMGVLAKYWDDGKGARIELEIA